MPKGYVAWINDKWGFGVIGVPGPPVSYLPFPWWEAETALRTGGWVSYELDGARVGDAAKHVRAIPDVGPLPDNRGCPRCGAMIDEGVRVHREKRSIVGALLPFRSKLYLEVYLTLECYQCPWKRPEQLVALEDHGRPKTIWPSIMRKLLE